MGIIWWICWARAYSLLASIGNLLDWLWLTVRTFATHSCCCCYSPNRFDGILVLTMGMCTTNWNTIHTIFMISIPIVRIESSFRRIHKKNSRIECRREKEKKNWRKSQYCLIASQLNNFKWKSNTRRNAALENKQTRIECRVHESLHQCNKNVQPNRITIIIKMRKENIFLKKCHSFLKWIENKGYSKRKKNNGYCCYTSGEMLKCACPIRDRKKSW